MRLHWILFFILATAGCQSDSDGDRRINQRSYLLELPVLANTEISAAVGSDDPDSLQLAGQPVVLAYGDDYPSELDLRPQPYLVGRCAVEQDNVRWREATSDSDTVTVEVVEDSIGMAVNSTGFASLTVTGEFTTAEPSSHEPCQELLDRYSGTIPFIVTVEIDVREVSGLKLDDCATVTEVSKLAGTAVQANALPTGPDGEVFEPANAELERAVSLRIGGDARSLEFRENTHLGEPSLSDLILPNERADIVISGVHGGSAVLRTVLAEDVTELDAYFEIPGGSGPLRIENGATYRAADYGGTLDRVFPIVGTQAVAAELPFCSTLPNDAFVLNSETADACATESRELIEYKDFKLLSFSGQIVEQAAHVRQSGECSLRLEAPGLNAGGGLSWTVSAGFEDVDDLTSMDREN